MRKHNAQSAAQDPKLTEWVILAQQGDRRAMEILVEQTQVRLYRFCVFMSRNDQLAKDICQDAYVKVMENLKKLKKPEAFVSWLLIAAHRLFLDHAKGLRYRNHSSLDSIEEPSEVQHPEEREKALQIRKVMAQLKPEDQSALLLVDMMGYSYEEAAEIMGTTEPSLRSRLSRARVLFADKYQAR